MPLRFLKVPGLSLRAMSLEHCGPVCRGLLPHPRVSRGGGIARLGREVRDCTAGCKTGRTSMVSGQRSSMRRVTSRFGFRTLQLQGPGAQFLPRLVLELLASFRGMLHWEMDRICCLVLMGEMFENGWSLFADALVECVIRHRCWLA